MSSQSLVKIQGSLLNQALNCVVHGLPYFFYLLFACRTTISGLISRVQPRTMLITAFNLQLTQKIIRSLLTSLGPQPLLLLLILLSLLILLLLSSSRASFVLGLLQSSCQVSNRNLRQLEGIFFTCSCCSFQFLFFYFALSFLYQGCQDSYKKINFINSKNKL